MKIAQVISTYPPYRGGMGQVAFEYTERLRALGHDVEVFTPRYREVTGDPAFVHRLPALIRVGNAGLTPSLYRRLRPFDVVHLHYPFFGGAEPVALRRALEPDQGLVVSYYMDAAASGVRGAVFAAYERLVLPSVVSAADRLLVSSLDYARHSALCRVKGALDRAEVHPFGVDLDRFSPGDDSALRQTLRIDADEPVILFVGGLDSAHDFKGLPVLVDALAGLLDRRWRFVVVGDGDRRGTLERSASEHGLATRVYFAGDVSSDMLPRFYRMADLHVLPSTARAEAFGLVTLEAAASGIPSIVSDLPGVRTLVRDGETGLQVPPGDVSALHDAIRRVLDDEPLRARFGRAARARVEHECAWDPLIRRLEQTYRDVLERRRAARPPA